MKKYLIFFAFMAFFFTNCGKEDPAELTPLTESLASESNNWRSSKGNSGTVEVDPFIRELFEQSRDHYQQEVLDPYVYVPNNVKDQLKLNYIQETNRLEALGLESYINTLVSDGVINQALGDAYLAINTTIKSYEKATKDDIPALQFELDQHKKEVNTSSIIGEHGPTLALALEIILLDLENEYGDWLNGDSAQQREDCPLGEAIITALNVGTTLGVLGAAAAVTAAAIGLPIAAGLVVAFISYSFLVGFVGGFFSGLFGFPSTNVCDDCLTPQGISILSETSCSMTRTLHVYGSGDDANIWEWSAWPESDPTAVTNVVTTEPNWTVTQSDPEDPIVASVRPVCINEVDFYTETINLSVSAGPLGEVGTLNVQPGENGQTYDINEEVQFIMYSSNQASGNVEFSVDASSSIVHIEDEGTNYFVLGFHNPGTVLVTFEAKNICTGLRTSRSVLLHITN